MRVLNFRTDKLYTPHVIGGLSVINLIKYNTTKQCHKGKLNILQEDMTSIKIKIIIKVPKKSSKENMKSLIPLIVTSLLKLSLLFLSSLPKLIIMTFIHHNIHHNASSNFMFLG